MPSAAIAVVPLQRWLLVQSLMWLPVMVLLAVQPALPPLLRALLAALVPCSQLTLVLVLGAGRRAADQITILRGMTAASALLLAPVASPWLCFGLLVAAALGDLLDGEVARRRGPSPAGAVLDMETDQLAVLVLAWLCRERGIAPFVLVLPSLRWLFVLAMRWRGLPAWDPKPAGDNTRGRTVCAIVTGSLLFALCPAVPPVAADLAVALAALLLLWSFTADARFLLTAGGRP
jgi:phosphatidylglycerophosphate synthase